MTSETVGIVLGSILLTIAASVIVYIIIKNAIRYNNLYKPYGEGQALTPIYDAATLKQYRLAPHGQPIPVEHVYRTRGDQDVIITGYEPERMYDRGFTEHSYGSKEGETDPILRTWDNDKAPYPATDPHSIDQVRRLRNGLPPLIFPPTLG